MFGKRSGSAAAVASEPARANLAPPPVAAPNLSAIPPSRGGEPAIETKAERRRSDEYYQAKSTVFGALIEAIDLAQLSRLEPEAAREEIRDIVSEIIALKNMVM